MKETSPVKRRLTAILAADGVGYSARMAEDEERTLRALAGHRRHIDGLIADHDGRLVGTASPAETQVKPAATSSFTMGLAQARCRRPDGNFSSPARGRARVVAGEVIIALGQPGEPGSVDLRGRPAADGTIVLDGFVIPSGGRARGTKVAARYEGRLTDGRGMLTGTQGGQRCTIGLQLK